MKLYKSIFILFFALALCFIPLNYVFAGFSVSGGQIAVTTPDTDGNFDLFFSSIFYFFDLRDRETFIQLTHTDLRSTGVNTTAHVQIFNVANNCNENNFFDIYTPLDTHTYNMRNIVTNDGNPSGVILPDGAYGIVAISPDPGGDGRLIGNLRIIDNNGYEYRTNAQAGYSGRTFATSPSPSAFMTFNFNSFAGTTLSDIVGLTLTTDNSGVWDASRIIPNFIKLDVDILNDNETIFSCRDIIFACVDENNPRLEELLEFAGSASVASFEYGINNAIPHSKGGELLCPGNNISEGIVKLTYEPYPSNIKDFSFGIGPIFLGFVGLNNGNGRGSLDSFWVFNSLFER